MKKLDLAPIAPGISMYVKGGTLSFLQLAFQEPIAECEKSRIGSSYDSTKGYILNGCLNSGSGSNYVISAGSVFFNGEVYIVPAASFTISGPNVAVGVITTTQFIADADPTDFTDGNQRNVHNIRQINFQSGLSGSGAFDFNNAVNLLYRPIGAIGQTIIWKMPGAGSQNTLLATYFDAGTGNGIHPLTLDWKIDATMSGHVAAGYLSGDPTYGTLGANKGADTYQIAATDLPTLSTDPKFESVGPGTDSAYITGGVATKGALTVNAGSPNNPIGLIQQTVIKLFITRYQ
ncbi:hypothetical protein [Mucilaginibacter sp. UR6-11]|uniref:hypothetical protein n=1 Tax=Mucilaginibacter sp. UR6-11 TaxID=1435644 RepID=UPI001E2F0E71|nr:hypothetical protein [Mucilaginibacter sp. UR6-11]MCC8426581.1 hypothetical protein [Mucilaginibacter sp. UR6-11]